MCTTRDRYDCVLFQERELKGKKIERFLRKKQRAIDTATLTSAASDVTPAAAEQPQVKRLDEQIEQLRADIAFIQDNINDCQANIMQMEETKVSNVSVQGQPAVG